MSADVAGAMTSSSAATSGRVSPLIPSSSSATSPFIDALLCASCSAPVRSHITDFGTYTRCGVCQTSGVELAHEPALTTTLMWQRWDTASSRQELLPVTLACDDSTGKQRYDCHRFEAFELQSTDQLVSDSFITTFDVFECREFIGVLEAIVEGPSDLIDMCETICGEHEKKGGLEAGKRDMDITHSSCEAAIATHPINEPPLDATATNAAAAVTPTAAELTAGHEKLGTIEEDDAPVGSIPDTTDEEEIHINGANIIRSVSAFIKGTKQRGGTGANSSSENATAAAPVAISSTVTVNVKPSVSRAGTVDVKTLSTATSSGAIAPFSTVQEETLSDLEVASDVSRAPSHVPNSATAANPHGVLTSHASTASSMPSLVPVKPTLPAGVTTKPDPSAASSSSAAAAPTSEHLPADLAEAISTVKSELDPFMGLEPLAALDDTSEFPGLLSSAGLYLTGSHMSVEAECGSGINARAFSIARSFSAFGQQVDEFGSGGRTMSSIGGGDGANAGSMMSGGDFGGSQDRTTSFTNLFGQGGPSVSMTGFGSQGGGDMNAQQNQQQLSQEYNAADHAISRQPTNVHQQQQQQQPPNSQQAAAASPTYLPQPTRLPSVLASPGSMPFGSGYTAASMSPHTNAFAWAAQRCPSILQSALPAAAFRQAYNEDVRARMRIPGSGSSDSYHGGEHPHHQSQQTSNPWSGVMMSPDGSSSHHAASASHEYGAMLTSSPSIGFDASNPSSLPTYRDGSGSQTIGGSQDLNDFDAPTIGAFGEQRTGSNEFAQMRQSEYGRMGSQEYGQQHQYSQMSMSPSIAAASIPQYRSPSPTHTPTPPAVPRPRLLDAAATAALSGASAADASASSLQRLSVILDRVSVALREPLQEFFALLRIDEFTCKLAGYICAETQKRGLCGTRQNSSVCAAALYMALTLENKKPTQHDFCRKINLTEVTLRKVQSELIAVWGLLVPIAYQPKNLPNAWPVRVNPPPPTPTPQVRFKLPQRSASSTIHAMHGHLKGVGRVPSIGTASAEGAGGLNRAPSYLYAPSAPVPASPSRGIPSSGAPSSPTPASQSSLLHSSPSRRVGTHVPPGYSVLAPTAAPIIQSGSSVRFYAPLPMTLQGEVIHSRKRSNTAMQQNENQPPNYTNGTTTTQPKPQLISQDQLAKWIRASS